MVYIAEIFPKGIPAKWINAFQRIGMDDNFKDIFAAVLQNVQQLCGGSAVKITDQPEVKVITILM